MKSILRPLGLLALTASLLGPLACAEESESIDPSPDCVAGKQCACSGTSCDVVCGGDGAGCDFDCGTDQSCSFSCPGGGCQANCAGSTACVLDCPGDTCNLICSGSTDRCEITACSATCNLTCGGATTCESSCDPISGGCVTTP